MSPDHNSRTWFFKKMNEINFYQNPQNLICDLFLRLFLTFVTCQDFLLKNRILYIFYIKHVFNISDVRLVFSRIFKFRGNLGNVEENDQKTCFFREMMRLGLDIYLAKFCYPPFLWCQLSLYWIFIRKRCQNGED